MDPLRIQSHTAKMADHIRRLPQNPFLVGFDDLRRDGVDFPAQQRMDAWENESRGLLDTTGLNDPNRIRELFKDVNEGNSDLFREDPRLKDVWRQYRETTLMMSSMGDFINYDKYFTNQQNLHESGRAVGSNNFGQTFIDYLDEVEDIVEDRHWDFSSLHGTAAHQKFMEMANEFNDKWQDEVFDAGAEE